MAVYLQVGLARTKTGGGYLYSHKIDIDNKKIQLLGVLVDCERYFFYVCLVIDKYCHSCRLFLENDLFPHTTSNAIKVGGKENFNPS